jgi:glyoxylate/hydroxypyruvate reductase A
MAILLITTPGPIQGWIDNLNRLLPDEDIRVWPDRVGDPADIDIALAAHQAAGSYESLPNLKLVMSLRAGIDDLLAALIPPHVTIARAQETGGNKMFDETVLMHVLRHHKRMPDIINGQRSSEWIDVVVKTAEERNVGFLGLGLIALSGARMCRDVGFNVAAWTKTPKTEPGIQSFHGDDQRDAFLARTEILMNLLPVTAETENILNAELFAKLPKDACVINLGRGEHLVDQDLIDALDSGHLHSATLDVFRTEPLPSDHPFWQHPRITVTPHRSRRQRPDMILPQVIENIRRFRAGEPLLQVVDRARGY